MSGPACAATVATWNNANLNTAGSVAAASGTGSVSRGSSLTYQATANAYNSSSWNQAGTAAQPTFGGDYVEIAVNTSGFGSINLLFTDLRNANGPTNVGVWYSSNGGASFTLASTVAPVNGIATARTINVSAITALNNNANVVFRLHGYNASTNGGQCQFASISVTGTDIVAPTVSSINRTNTNPTNATTVNFTVTFSESVTGVAANNFTLVGSGVTGAIGTVTGSGTTWNVPVTSVSGSGTLKLNLDQNLANIQDAASNAVAAAFTTGQSYSVDQTVPTVTSITRVDPNPTAASTVNFLVTFSESVTGVTSGNFSLVLTGSAGGSIGAVTGTGATRNVAVNSVSGNGTIGLNLDQNITTIIDTVTNPLAGTFTTGQFYTIDQPPSVSSINRADTNPTNATTVNFTVTFTESVTGVTTSNFTVVGTGVTGSLGTVTGSGTTWNVPVTSVSGTGTIKVSLDQNLTGITDGTANPLSASFTTGQAYNIDQTAPTVSSINRADVNPTNAASVNFTVTFSESVTGVSTASFTAVGVGATGTVSNVSGSGASYTVTVNSLSGSGTLRLDLDQNLSSIADTVGNPLSVAFSAGQSYTVDRVAPSVSSVTRVNASPTFAATVNFTVTFSESVTGVTGANFSLALTGTATGTIGAITGTGATRNVTITGVAGNGTLGLNLDQNITTIVDSLANPLAATFTTGETYTIDQGPAVASINRANTNPTNATTVNFTVTFSESVTGVSAANFSVVGAGVTGTIGTVTGSGTTWNVPVITVAGTGTLQVDLNLSLASITDSIGNSLAAAFTTGQSYTIDQTPPAVMSINRASADPTNATSVNFTVTFSENVTGLGTANFTAVGTGTVTGSVSNVVGSGASYTVTVNTLVGDGTLRLDLNQNLAGIIDAVGNNPVAFTTGQVYTVDHTAPAVVSIARTGASPTNSATLGYLVTFSESVTGVALNNFSLTTTGGVAGTISSVTGTGATRTVTITGVTGDGTLRLNLNANLANVRDLVNNALTAGFTTGEVYTLVHPSFIIESFTIGGGDGDNIIEPIECTSISVTIKNLSASTATSLSATLATSAAGAFISQGSSIYPDLAPGASAANTFFFFVSTTNAFSGIVPPVFDVTLNTTVGPVPLSFQTAAPSRTSYRFDNTTPVAIPDSPRNGRSSTIDSPITVSGLSGVLADTTVSINITHPKSRDLRVSLVAPDGTIVSLVSKRGGNSGANFGSGCADNQRTTFSDAAGTSISAGASPYVGTFNPEVPFATLLRGKPASVINGVWKLRMSDTKPTNIGTLNCWSLGLQTADINNGPSPCSLTPTAELTITKTGTPPVPLNGGTITYNMTVSNAGPYIATNVVMTDSLPLEVTYNSGSASGGGVLVENSGLVQVTWASIAPGDSRTVQITVTVDESGTIINTATVLANELDTNSADSAATAINLVGTVANLVVTNVAAPTPIQVGSGSTFTVRVTNNGPDPAEAITLTHDLPASVIVGSVSATSGTPVLASNIVTLQVGTLAVGAFVDLTVPVTSTVCGLVTTLGTAQNGDADSNPSDNTNVVGTLDVREPAPGILIGSPSTALTSAGPVNYSITYSGAVSYNLTAADVTLNTTGFASGAVTVLNGTTANPTVQISGITGNGTIGISIAAGTATACGGLTAPAVGPSATFQVDNVSPGITLSSVSPDPTNATIVVTVVTTEATTDFSAGDITPTNATVSNFSGSGTSYSFDLVGNSPGLLSVTVNASQFHDAAGNPNTASNVLTRAWDTAQPTMTLNTVTPNPSNGNIAVTAVSNKPTSDFTSGDVTTTNANVANFAGSGSSYTFDLVPIAQGLVSAAVAANVFQDGATNLNLPSNVLTHTFDSIAPTISLTCTDPDPTNAAITISVLLSESATDFGAVDINPTNATVANFSGSGTTYSFDLVPTSDGLFSANVPAGAFHDSATNANIVSNTISRTFDSTPPTILLSTIAPASTNATIPVTVLISESTVDFDAGDVNVANATIANFSGSGTSYSFDLLPVTDGLVSTNVDPGTFHDSVGNANLISNTLVRGFDSTSPTILLSTVAPAVTNATIPVIATISEATTDFSAADVNATNATVANFSGSGTNYTYNLIPTVDGPVDTSVDLDKFHDTATNGNTASNLLSLTFDSTSPTIVLSSAAPPVANTVIAVTVVTNEATADLDASDITATNATVANFAGSGTGYSFDLAPTAQGVATASVNADKFHDAATNGNAASNLLSRTFDSTSPTITLSTGAPSVTNATIAVSVTISEATTDFDASDISGTNATVSGFGGSGSSYSFNLVPAAEGAVSASVGAGKFSDGGGNANTASNSISATYDITLPVSSSSVVDYTRAGVALLPINFTAADLGGIASTKLYVKTPVSSVFADSGLQASAGTSGTFMYTPVAGTGRYQFAARSTDLAGNAQAIPTGPGTIVLFNAVANGAYASASESGNDALVFPMLDDLDVTITLSGASVGTTYTVSRAPALAPAPAYFADPARLADESLTITRAGAGDGTASLEWPLDNPPIDVINKVWRFESGVLQQSYIPAVNGATVTVTGITTFSEWYAGNSAAVGPTAAQDWTSYE
ncbi:MAG: Ig-like domain-containing protein [Candidatus Sumerlaeaceae bacterium]